MKVTDIRNADRIKVARPLVIGNVAYRVRLSDVWRNRELPEDGVTVRLFVGPAEASGPWSPMSWAKALSEPSDGELWTWLRRFGLRRPSPSGANARRSNLPESDRNTVRVSLRLRPAMAKALLGLAERRALTMNRFVEELIESAASAKDNRRSKPQRP